MKMIRKSLVLLAISCVASRLIVSAFGEGPLDLELQLKTGDEIPGLEGQVTRILEVSSGQPGSMVLRVGLTQPGGLYREAVVLKSSEGIQKIIAEDEPLPGGAGALRLQHGWLPGFDAPFLQMSSRGAVGLVLGQGVFLYEQGVLDALAVKGQDVPGTGATISDFLSWAWEAHYYDGMHTPPTGSFMNIGGQVLFAAALSDGRNGVFLASRQAVLPVLIAGDQVPGREGLRFQRDLAPVAAMLRGNHLTIAVYDDQFGAGVFHYTAGQLSTILIETDDVGGRGRVGYLACFDGNENGSVALGINLREDEQIYGPTELLVWSRGSGIQKLLDASSILPGIETGARFFTFVSLDPEDRLIFAAEGRPGGLGFYFWDKGKVEKIVAQGDASPIGGTFYLGSHPSITPRPPNLAILNLFPVNGRKEVAFMATIVTTLSPPPRKLPCLWSGQTLSPILVESADLPGFGGRPVEETSIDQLTPDGRLLLHALGCCDDFHAVYATAPVPPTPPGFYYADGFQWTDNDELFVSARVFGGSQSVLYCWRDGSWTTVLDGAGSVLNTPGAVVSPSYLHWRIWPAQAFDSPIISVYPSGDAPEGLYVGVKGGIRELLFPQVLGSGGGRSPITDLTLTNDGDTTQVRLQVPDGNGGTHFAGDSVVGRKEDTSIAIDGDAPFAGWLLVEAAGGDINARLGLSLFEGTGDYVRLAVPFSVPLRECSTTTPPVNFGELGLAFANPYCEAAEVTVELLGPGLEVERQENVQLTAQGQKSLYVSEIFGEQVPGRLLRIKANFPVATFAAVQSPRGVAVQPVF